MRWRPIIVTVAIAAAAGAAVLAQAKGPRFYPDDPLVAEPAPLPVANLEPRALSDLLERLNNTFRMRGEQHPSTGVIPAQGVNSLGEVMDGDWYINRHATRRMTIAELQRGPGSDVPPKPDAPWQVLVVKPYGATPGLLIADAKKDLYILRFDPPGHAGLITGAEMVTSRFFYALGYHVPETYLIRFDRSQLMVNEEGQAVSSAGRTRVLRATDLDTFLRLQDSGENNHYRAVALRLPERRQALLGPYQMWGTRSDDPNDTVPHEHRRDLRGMFVFSAWLNHTDARAVGTQDVLAGSDGVQRIRHLVFDFTQSLGSGRLEGPKLAWEGNEAEVPTGGVVKRNLTSFGVVAPAWMKAKQPDLPEVGTFEATAFDPSTWTTVQPLPPFVNRLPDDTFWAARQVMAFTDEDIRAIVQTAQYSKAAEDWITATLIERRNRTGKAFFAKVLPLDAFRVAENSLRFDDLGVKYGFAQPRTFTIDWFGFDNASDTARDQLGTGPAVPSAVQALPAGAYLVARVHAGDPAFQVGVYLRKRGDTLEVVGLDRAWPGKVVVQMAPPLRPHRRIFTDLSERQQALIGTYVDAYNKARGSQYSVEEGFDRLTVSEQSTFYAITHALTHTPLTDMAGAPLGTALDLVVSVERVAGQYNGRGGDEQFRIFVNLKPDALDVLKKSREFFHDHENTVYHAGYPQNFRQVGKEPSIQISASEDGLRGDIDVDYRSGKSPQGLFNGHLTASNSDVRVGDNAKRHGTRWGGLIAWWQDAFGNVPESAATQEDALDLDRPDLPDTPLPPDRPAGAKPDRIEDAAQEFLTDWLVRRQYSQALEALSSRSYACVNIADNPKGVPLDATAARRELRRLMEYATGKLGTTTNLTNAIVAVTPRDPKRVIVAHAFQREFLLTPMPEAQARTYLCDRNTAPATGGEYYGVVFQFRRAGGGTLGLLWTREGDQWKLVSYQPLSQ